MGLETLSSPEQLKVWEERALDARSSLPLGFPFIDERLFRGGLQPGLVCMVGGRTHTRKTSFMLNVVANMLRAGACVGLVGLDETTPMYVAKLCSALSVADPARGDDGHDAEWLELHWKEKEAEAARARYALATKRLAVSRGARPTLPELSSWLEVSEVNTGRPQVVFIDYLGKLARGRYDGNDNTRLPRLAEELTVWAEQEQVAVIAVHQVGRESKNTGNYYHGDTPMQLESLRSGGEEPCDIVLGTYRPALSPLGNMSREDAEADLGKDFNEERWMAAQERVMRFEHSTMVQVLKNRPSQRGLLLRGVELFSPGASMYMRQRGEDDLDEEQQEYEEARRRAASE